uniref:CKK domain-containing protein n=1 Tax=Anopheles atroparvus TaxID=41427 RepID=A0AAG5DK29_ANOAO
MLLCVSCATISEIALLGGSDFSHLNDGKFYHRSVALRRRTLAAPTYVHIEGLSPAPEEKENLLNHWYCDRCMAVHLSIRRSGVPSAATSSKLGANNSIVKPEPSKTDKLIELVRRTGINERKERTNMSNQQQQQQHLVKRSEARGRDGTALGLKECLVNVFQRLAFESSTPRAEVRHRSGSMKQKSEASHGIDAAARKLHQTKQIFAKDSDSGLGRATPPRRAPSPGMGPSSRHLPSPSGPGSLPPGLITKRRGFDDGSSDISSNASSMMDYNGPRLYKQPATKSNRGIILNAVEYCVFPGAVNRDAKQKVLEKIARSEAKHFLVLFRDAGCQFRALYGYWPENEQIIKLYGTGPSQVDDVMFDKFFKYNSGGKCFTQVHTKHLTVTIDAFTIHNSLWQGKKANLPSKKDMALVI